MMHGMNWKRRTKDKGQGSIADPAPAHRTEQIAEIMGTPGTSHPWSGQSFRDMLARTPSRPRDGANRLAKRRPDHILVAMTFRVVLEHDAETGDYSAVCPELPGCASAGETEEDARANIREAIELYLAPGDIELPENGKLVEVTVG